MQRQATDLDKILEEDITDTGVFLSTCEDLLKPT